MRGLFALLLGVLGVFVAAPVFAQSFSGTGSKAQMLERSCSVQVTRVREGVEQLKTLIEEIEGCHRAGQVYNGTSCRDYAIPAHEWEVVGEDIFLKMQTRPGGSLERRVNEAGVAQNFRGAKGDRGADASCPPGYCEAGTVCNTSSGGSSSGSSSSGSSSSGASSSGASSSGASSSGASSSGASSSGASSTSSSTSSSSSGGSACNPGPDYPCRCACPSPGSTWRCIRNAAATGPAGWYWNNTRNNMSIQCP